MINHSNIILPKGVKSTIEVAPRWPQKDVVINEAALKALIGVQSRLTDDILLVLTRAYQSESFFLKYLRWLGSYIFVLIYPKRKIERYEIFSCNGHAIDGCHIDISIRIQGKMINFLPFSVFTPIWVSKKLRYRYDDVIKKVESALTSEGFKIHRNPIEALQIHCDWTLKT